MGSEMCIRDSPTTERAFFEPRFGQDLSGVRIHTGGTADTAARAINARAFSLGNSIALLKEMLHSLLITALQGLPMEGKDHVL